MVKVLKWNSFFGYFWYLSYQHGIFMDIYIIDLSKASSHQTKILPIHWGTIKTEEEDRGRNQIVPQGQDTDQARYDPKK